MDGACRARERAPGRYTPRRPSQSVLYLEALRRVRGGKAARKVARKVGIPEWSVRNWVKAQAAGKLGGVEGGKPITLEPMELSRLRAENARLAALRALGVLDTSPEKRFDRITRLAVAAFEMPIALVSLVDHDRQ